MKLARETRALAALGASRPSLVAWERNAEAALALTFDNGDTLLIEDHPEPAEDDVEYWRLFNPALITPHFVVSSDRVEWHEHDTRA